MTLSNDQIKEREMLLFGKKLTDKDYLGGVVRFDEITIPTAQRLIELGYLEPTERQNESPTAETMIEWGKKWNDKYGLPIVFVHGYVVSHKREDCRITLEGIRCFWLGLPNLREMIDDFINQFRNADEFSYDEEHGFCWWD